MAAFKPVPDTDGDTFVRGSERWGEASDATLEQQGMHAGSCCDDFVTCAGGGGMCAICRDALAQGCCRACANADTCKTGAS